MDGIRCVAAPAGQPSRARTQGEAAAADGRAAAARSEGALG